MPLTRAPADRAIFEASARLAKLMSQIATFRAGLADLVLPIEAANDRLDHSDDLIAIVVTQLSRAAALIEDERDRLEKIEDAIAIEAWRQEEANDNAAPIAVTV